MLGAGPLTVVPSGVNDADDGPCTCSASSSQAATSPGPHNDGDAIVTEIRDFVISLEARHHAPSTVAHTLGTWFRLGNYLAATGELPAAFSGFRPNALTKLGSSALRRPVETADLAAVAPQRIFTSMNNQPC